MLQHMEPKKGMSCQSLKKTRSSGVPRGLGSRNKFTKGREKKKNKTKPTLNQYKGKNKEEV